MKKKITLLCVSIVVSVLVGEGLFRLYYNIRADSMPFSYKLNSMGFRDDEISLRRSTDRSKRLMVLGDSYTFGYGVEYESIYPVLLENTYTKYSDMPVEVLNFSMPGWNTKAEAEFFFRVGKKYDFDILILAYTFNDIEKEPIIVKHPRMMSTVFQLTMLHTAIYRIYQLKQYLIHGRKPYSFTLKSFYTDKRSFEWEQMEKSIRELNDYCKKNNKTFLIFYFEIYSDVHGSLKSMIRDRMTELANKYNIEFVGIEPLRDRTGIEQFQVHRFDSHPNALAHSTAADVLIEHLGRRKEQEL